MNVYDFLAWLWKCQAGNILPDYELFTQLNVFHTSWAIHTPDPIDSFHTFMPASTGVIVIDKFKKNV